MRFGSPQYTLYGSPQFAFCLLRNTCFGSTQYFPVLRNARSTSPQYAFHLSAIYLLPLRKTPSASPQDTFLLSVIRLPPLRNKQSSSPQYFVLFSALAYFFSGWFLHGQVVIWQLWQLHILTTWYRRQFQACTTILKNGKYRIILCSCAPPQRRRNNTMYCICTVRCMSVRVFCLNTNCRESFIRGNAYLDNHRLREIVHYGITNKKTAWKGTFSKRLLY